MSIEQERAEFEAWYQQHHGHRDMYERDASSEYADKQVQGAFNLWLARAALAQQDDETRNRALVEDQGLTQQDGDKVDADPLQGATEWLLKAVHDCEARDLQHRLLIGHNRATRLIDAARKEPAP